MNQVASLLLAAAVRAGVSFNVAGTGAAGMEKRDKNLESFWDKPLHDLLQLLQATPAGLTTGETRRRLRLYGPNSMAQEPRLAGLLTFLRLFANPLVVILLVASGISLGLGDQVGGLIIIAIVLLSVLLNFSMEFQARHAVAEIRKQVATTAAVMRDGLEQELPIADLVPGDIIRLNAGDLVPADARLLDVKDLQVRESALTGESLPVEKSRAICQRGSTVLPTRPTVYSWALRFRQGLAPRSSSAQAEVLHSEGSRSVWLRGRRRPSLAAAYATSG